ncbi:MAG: hypothetical protein HY906_00710 [Deltaproteobacteria bacterium]|nr:hypothetical protein [Deltaproteobacteria bacterium]
MPRPVTLNWTEFETAFERNAPGTESYLDLASGEILTVVEGQADAAERRARVGRSPESFVRIEPVSSREQYRWMERFVVTVADAALRERLLIAIDGKGAFRRFKDVLLNYPGERERWFAYRADLLHCRMKAWLEQVQIEPTVPPPWGDVVLPPEPAEPPPRPVPGTSESPGEVLRREAKEIIDQVPAVELPSAIAFLEFLRDRGSPALLGGRTEPRRRPALVEDPADEDPHEDEAQAADVVALRDDLAQR